MNRFLCTLYMCLFLAVTSFSQVFPTYTFPQYSVRSQSNIKYGTVTNFAGKQEDLSLDLYKPVGDKNCKRPLMVFVHGGAFIGGDKADASIVALCKELTKFGFNVASVNYRLKGHVATNFTPAASCPTNIVSPCLQSLDTAEVYRGIYRGMQDIKGAIRFLKGRAAQDSTDANVVFVGGESAGSILALAAAYIDKASEKPAFCGALPDAGAPDSDLVSCLPAGYALTRPDLGEVEGTLNLNGQNSKVLGCADFFGAVWSDVFNGPNDPALYMYHQTNDVVVDCGTKQGMYSLFNLCLTNFGCPKLGAAPVIMGTCTIAEMLKAKGANAPIVFNDIISAGGPNCLANGHATVNVPLRITNVTKFFAPIIKATGNVGGAACVTANDDVTLTNLQLFPNPSDGQVTVFFGKTLQLNTSIQVVNSQGQLSLNVALDGTADKMTLDCSALPQGIYFLQISGNGERGLQRLVIMK
jgi:hypothetical protein